MARPIASRLMFWPWEWAGTWAWPRDQQYCEVSDSMGEACDLHIFDVLQMTWCRPIWQIPSHHSLSYTPRHLSNQLEAVTSGQFVEFWLPRCLRSFSGWWRWWQPSVVSGHPPRPSLAPFESVSFISPNSSRTNNFWWWNNHTAASHHLCCICGGGVYGMG
jgi:hypothetical protein